MKMANFLWTFSLFFYISKEIPLIIQGMLLNVNAVMHLITVFTYFGWVRAI